MASPLTITSDGEVIAPPVLSADSDATITAGPTVTALSDAEIILLLETPSDALVILQDVAEVFSDAIVAATSTASVASDAEIIEIPIPPIPPTPPPDPTPNMSPFVPPGSDCANASDCFPCNKLPGTNTSSEAQDVFQDFVIQWGNLQTNTPPLGSLFQANGCTIVCVSSISQEEAFLCAQRTQALCVIDKWQPPPFEPAQCLNFPCAPTVPPVVPPPAPFTNEPEACSTRCPDGSPFTFAVPGGSFVSASQAMANRIAASFACREALLHKLCMSLVSPFACLDQSSTLTFIASGVTVSPTSNVWELRSGNLPPGMTFGSATTGPVLSITGVPTALGDYTFSIRVTAPSGDFAERTYTVTVAGITTADPLPDGDPGVPYSETFTSAGFTGDLIWLIFSGELPDGLELDEETGELSGTPTEAGEFEFTVSVSSATHGCEKLFHLTVGCFFVDDLGLGSIVSTTNTPGVGGTKAFLGGAGSNRFFVYWDRAYANVDTFIGGLPAFANGVGTLANAAKMVYGTVAPSERWCDAGPPAPTPPGPFQNVTLPALPPGFNFVAAQKMVDDGAFMFPVTDNGNVLAYAYLYRPEIPDFLQILVTNPVGTATTRPYDMNTSRVVVGAIDPPLANTKAVKITGGNTATDIPIPADAPILANRVTYGVKISDSGAVAGFWVDLFGLGVLVPFHFDPGSGTSTSVMAESANWSLNSFAQLVLSGDGTVMAGTLNDVAHGGITQGFIYQGGVFTQLSSFPDTSDVLGVTDDGIVVGNHNGVCSVWRNGVWTTLLALGMSDAGWTVAGVATPSNGANVISSDGFLFGNGVLAGTNRGFACKICL